MIGVVHHHQVLGDRTVVEPQRDRKQATVRHLEGRTVDAHIGQARLLRPLGPHDVGRDGGRTLRRPHRHLNEDHALVGALGRYLFVVRLLSPGPARTQQAQHEDPDQEE